jgi:hypothetical protein
MKKARRKAKPPFWTYIVFTKAGKPKHFAYVGDDPKRDIPNDAFDIRKHSRK